LKNKVSLGGGILIDGLYRIILDLIFYLNYLSMYVDSSIKKKQNL